MEQQICGRFTITVNKATGLFPKALNGKANPVCALSNDKKLSQKTKTISNTLDPVFDQTLSFNIFHPFDNIEVTVNHDNSDDRIQSDCFMGRVRLNISNYTDQQPHNLKLELQAREMKDEVSGFIELTVQYKFTRDWEKIYASIDLMKKKEFEKALEYISSSIELYPSISTLYGIRSEICLSLNQFKNAMRDAAKALELNPNLSESYYFVGRVYEYAGKIEQAEGHYKSGLSLNNKDPQITEAMNRIKDRDQGSPIDNVGGLDDPLTEMKDLMGKGNYSKAIELFNQYIKNDPTNFSCYLGRAICYLGKNNLLQAQDDCLKVVEYNQQWPKNNPQKEGWIKKGGKINTRKKKRWFILQSYFLFYYNSQESSSPNGVIPIYHSTISSTKEKRLSISLQNRVYQLYFEDKTSFNDWMNVLKKLSTSILELPRSIILPRSLQRTTSAKNFGNLSGRRRRLSVNLIQDRLSKLSSRFVLDSREGEVKAGYMYKTGALRKDWKKRFFILKNRKLYYFHSEPTERANIEALGEIDLETCLWRKGENDPLNPGRHIFELVTPLRTFYLYDITQHDMLAWKEAIERSNGTIDTSVEDSIMDSSDISHNNNNNIIINQTISEQNLNINNQQQQQQQYLPNNEAGVSDQLASLDNILNAKDLEVKAEDSFSSFNNSLDTSQDLSDLIESKRLTQNQMSNSEGKYFKKFGLEPPKDMTNNRKSVLLSTGDAKILNNNINNYNNSSGGVATAGNPYNPERRSIQYTSYAVEPPVTTPVYYNNNNQPNYTINNNVYVSPNNNAAPDQPQRPVMGTSRSNNNNIQQQEKQALINNNRPPTRRPPPPQDDGCCIIL